MAVGEESNNEPLDQIFLADDDLVDFIEQRLHEGAGLLHLGVDSTDAGIHFRDDNARWTSLPASAFRKSERHNPCAGLFAMIMK